jgi:hypothetical protein
VLLLEYETIHKENIYDADGPHNPTSDSWHASELHETNPDIQQ